MLSYVCMHFSETSFVDNGFIKYSFAVQRFKRKWSNLRFVVSAFHVKFSAKSGRMWQVSLKSIGRLSAIYFEPKIISYFLNIQSPILFWATSVEKKINLAYFFNKVIKKWARWRTAYNNQASRLQHSI